MADRKSRLSSTPKRPEEVKSEESENVSVVQSVKSPIFEFLKRYLTSGASDSALSALSGAFFTHHLLTGRSERASNLSTEFLELLLSSEDLTRLRKAVSGQMTHEIVRQGITYSALESFLAVSHLPQREVLAVADISPRTLQRRKAEGRLTPVESDRLWRVTHLYRLAVELFEGSLSDASKWLTSPSLGLGGRTPLEFAQTEAGAREVENLIGRLEHGVIS